MWERQKSGSLVNPAGSNTISVKFSCSKCNTDIIEPNLIIPAVNNFAKNAAESDVMVEKPSVCQNHSCAESCIINITNGTNKSVKIKSP